MKVCRWKINEVCCNRDSEYVEDYPYPRLECTEGDHCRCYEKENTMNVNGELREEIKELKDKQLLT